MEKVIVVFGLPGSGKSYFAKHLAKSLDADHINTDLIRRALFTQREYSSKEQALVYRQLHTDVLQSVIKGRSVIVDGTFYRSKLRADLVDLLARKNIIPVFIEVVAHPSVLHKRLESPRDVSEANFEVYLLLKQKFEPMLADHLTLVSTNGNIQEMLRAALNYIDHDQGKPIETSSGRFYS